jgi:arginine N-succinyltransferase
MVSTTAMNTSGSLVIRPIARTDLPALLELARGAGVGLTTLPNNEAQLNARIEASVATFAGKAERAERQWVFVLDDVANERLAGICAIAGAVGLREPWYSYRVGTVVHASRELGIFTQTPTLFLSNDHTGASELCSLFLHPDYRAGKNGALLSKCRFLFMAEWPQLFSEKVIAELRGVSDDAGCSPFWESLGRHFFSMDFAEADYLTGIGKKSFVAELMPKHPLYSSFLSPEAQAVIGETHALTKPARRLLEQEGFRFEGHVDIFDAGPAVECNVRDIDAVKKSSVVIVAAIVPDTDVPADATSLLVATRDPQHFRVALAHAMLAGDSITLNQSAANALNLAQGASVRAVALMPQDRHQ